MPIFKYKGYSAAGGEVSGTIEAEGPRDAAVRLKNQGLYPKNISELKRRKTAFSSRIDSKRIPSITRQLGVLVRSGVPIVEALRALSEESTGGLRSILVELKEKVQSGSTLSRALETHKELFPDFYRHMVSAAEESGNLDGTLTRLADFLEGQERTREKVRTAMIYPTIMAFVAFIVMLMLFTFVVPRIVQVFENHEAALPLATVILIALSNLFVNYWWAVIMALVALVFAARKLRGRFGFEGLMMKLLSSLYISRFTRTLSFLLMGGLPIMKALELAGRASGSPVIERAASGAAHRVSEGSALAAALDGLPPVLRELIATGEKSGKLPEVLEQAALSYEGEFDRLVQRALAYLEPAMILVMAAVVAFIVFSVLLPLFQMNQLIG